MRYMNSFGVNKVQLQNPIRDTETVVYDSIYFGNYMQTAEDKGVSSPIRWRVLSVSDHGKAKLLSDKNLDIVPFNLTVINTNWENSTIRSWLNGYNSEKNSCGIDYSDSNSFIARAFTEQQQKSILGVHIGRSGNPYFKMERMTVDSANVYDKLFLLAYEDMINSQYGFSKDDLDCKARVRVNTAYVQQFIDSKLNISANEYWLRTYGESLNTAMFIDNNGAISSYGCVVKSSPVCVCPAMYIDLKTADWKYAGKIEIQL